MTISQRANKWVVLVLTTGLAMGGLLRSTVPGGFGAAEWVAVPVVASTILTSLYLAWCLICGGLARALRVAWEPRTLRTFANGSFLPIMLALVFIPIKATMTITLPMKIHIVVPDTPPA